MPLAHAILGFLNFSPMSGYDLKKNFDQSVVHFWSATQSHIYKALKTLEGDGFIKSKIIPQEGKPNRNEYQITEAGRNELRRWQTTHLTLDPVREAWLIQVFFAHSLSNEEIAAIFEKRAEELEARLDVYADQVQAALDENAKRIGQERVRQLWQITLDYGIAFFEFQKEWNQRMVEGAHHLPPLTPQRYNAH